MRLLERYEQDLQHIKDAQGWVLLLGLLAALVLLPLVAPGYIVYNVTLFFVFSLVAVALMILVGFTGQVSLGHAGFLAAGAYTTAYLVSVGWPFVLALVAALLVSGALGVVIGLPALRLEGPYLAIATLGFGLAIQQILNNWRLVGASTGMLADRPRLLGVDFFGDTPFYFFTLVIVGFFVWLAFNLKRSHVGRAFVAIRDAELAAQMSGVDVARFKTLAFALSAAMTGVAGGLYGALLGYITPESFNLILSVKFLLMIVVGGLGFLPGAILGAAFITGLEVVLSAQQNRSQLLFGVVVILIMLLEPRGLYGRWQKVRRYWQTWPL
ncbi:branched-chain amino acid ABC transporter permease [Truepera radiovictrix]|uniref:Inner-membrane translocator n=1 Tax=Truepera radiovictrix (strain DSM 17093 / CIP 108686 / LMG 22925 / RQ-24) TaxID=649638 RepID=D7CSU2_TRURR|nr:branched-chain amino acid ABC transporter permease [Truepera radiovictrix]ADI13709.1 inner-membrane translocator [Truepera radiovictrix DSM 17093]WMT57726.1 branched-chain amino acid ABC transporter permease [Truepera radiovictrix]